MHMFSSNMSEKPDNNWADIFPFHSICNADLQHEFKRDIPNIIATDINALNSECPSDTSDNHDSVLNDVDPDDFFF